MMNPSERREWRGQDRDEGMRGEERGNEEWQQRSTSRGGRDETSYPGANRSFGGGYERPGDWERSSGNRSDGPVGPSGVDYSRGFGGGALGYERGGGAGQGGQGGAYYERGEGYYGASSPYGGGAGLSRQGRVGGEERDVYRGGTFGPHEYGYGAPLRGRATMDEGRFELGPREGRDDGRARLGAERGGLTEKVGRFFGVGPKGYKRSDPRIQEDVCDDLMEHPEIDASNIEVRVHDGEVTLEGSVSERRVKRLCEDVAERVRGVTEVHNHLRVAKAEQQAAGSAGGTSEGAKASGRDGRRTMTS